MRYTAATAWVSAMNAANYLGHNNWQLPTTPITESQLRENRAERRELRVRLHGGGAGVSLQRTGVHIAEYGSADSRQRDWSVQQFSTLSLLVFVERGDRRRRGTLLSRSLRDGRGPMTLPNFLYLLPMIPGKLPGTPAATGTGLQVNPGGQSVYDPITNITWAANANLAASNAFGLPQCTTPTSPAVCVAADGAMTWSSAVQYLANVNSVRLSGPDQLAGSHD